MGLDRNTMSQDNVSCNIVWIADAAYTAAVSERRIFVLSSTGMAPALSASSHSLSEKPPSGPIMAVAEDEPSIALIMDEESFLIP